jgi:nicotinate-nucleotide pyrophosphorylase (carboxylating)
MTLKNTQGLSEARFLSQVRANVAAALEEDLGPDVRTGDLTAALVPAHRVSRARVIAREAAVICGHPWADEVMRQAAPNSRMEWHIKEGERCQQDQVLLHMHGPARELLSAERSVLNFVQLLSAVATKTAVFVDAVKGTRAAIVDTRKTLPGLRVAQKYAVQMGGGVNHRMGLHDAILIKENHIAAAGGVAAVMKQTQALASKAAFIEIEVETLAQLQEALDCGAKMVLLDNMPIPTLQEAVRINAGRAVLEISGGVNLDTVASLAKTGVDRISIGTLTKDVKAIDLSMRMED